jgi:hypothetical protein
MAAIFVSYTSSDREWAFWIDKELKALGHTPHLHEGEIDAGHDIVAWMKQHRCSRPRTVRHLGRLSQGALFGVGVQRCAVAGG